MRKSVENAFFFIASVAIIGALIITAVNEASFNISQVLLMLALVLITFIYAARTSDIAKATRAQADASVKMAGETKDARFAALKPIISIDWNNGDRGRAVSPYFNNIGKGPALNVKYYFTHTKFEFKDKKDKTTLEVGERDHNSLLTEEFDFKDWTGFAIQCDYQSIYGENFCSILRFKTEQERNLEILELKQGVSQND